MPEKTYFIHFNGENLGPISLSLLKKLIQMGRIHGTDFAASEGSGEWQRVQDMAECSNAFAQAPRAAVPTSATTQSIAAESAPAARTETRAPKAAPAAEPKAETKTKAEAKPAPAPKPAPKEEPKAQPVHGIVTIGKKTFKIAGVRHAALLIEMSAELEEGAEVQMQFSGESFPKPFEMKAILMGAESYKGSQVHVAEFVRPNPAHKRVLAPFIDDENE